MNALVKFAVRLAICIVVVTCCSPQAHAGLPIITSIQNDARIIGTPLISQTLPVASVSYTDASGTSYATVTQLAVQNESGGSVGAYLSAQTTNVQWCVAGQIDAITFGPNDNGHVYVKWDANRNYDGDTTWIYQLPQVSFGDLTFESTTGRFEGDAAGKTIGFRRGLGSFSAMQLASGNSALYWSFNGWPGESSTAPLVLGGESKSMPAANKEQTILQDSSTYINPNTLAIGTQSNSGVGIDTPVFTSHSPVEELNNYVNSLIIKFHANNPISTVQVPTTINTGQLSVNVVFKGCEAGNAGSLCVGGSGAGSGAESGEDGLISVPLTIGQEFNFQDYALNGVSQFLFTGVEPGDAENPVDMPVGLKFIAAGTTQLAITTYQATIDPFAAVGDYNHNGIVDAADYTVWRDSLGSTTDLTADGNNSGSIDDGDYNVWKPNFGAHSPGAGSGTGANANTAVPEPATLAVLLVGLLIICSRQMH